MKDGPVRIVLKFAARCVYFTDLKATRLIRRARGEKPYRLCGGCALCAKCCEEPAIQTGPLPHYFPLVRRLFLGWHRRVNGFELVGENRRLRIFSFRCTHFDPETRRCDSYASRPGMCRDYPRALLWQHDAPLFPECGYRAISRNADKVAELIDAEDLPPEKREELKRRLHAGE